MEIHKKIIDATSEYYKENIDYLKLSKASKEYKEILEDLCKNDINIEEGRNDIEFENGKALGTFWAALCLDDLLRTRQFIRGIDSAIKDKINNNDGEALNILYAGTGPFATLILPILLRYPEAAINYTFLEINPFTFKILKEITSKLGLEKYNITYVNEDATKYKLDTKNQPDIIISETMQNALENEQQVPIFFHLMNQAKKETIFIPEKIELYIALQEAGIPTEKLSKEHFHRQDKILEISKEFLFSLSEIQNSTDINKSFEKKETRIQKEKLKGFNQLVLITDIQVYKNEKIKISESGLTTPKILKNIPDDLHNSIVINSQYKVSSKPKLEYSITL